MQTYMYDLLKFALHDIMALVFSLSDFEAIYLFSVNTNHTSAVVKCIP